MFAYVGARGRRAHVTLREPRLCARREAGGATNAMLSAKPTAPPVAKTWAVTVGAKNLLGTAGRMFDADTRMVSQTLHLLCCVVFLRATSFPYHLSPPALSPANSFWWILYAARCPVVVRQCP